MQRLVSTLSGYCALFFSTALFATSIEVEEVEFGLVNQRGGPDWYECAVVLEVRRESGTTRQKHPDFVDDVVVELILGVEATRPGSRSFEFYTSRVHLVSLEDGQARVRFYLPPEIVERDSVRGRAHSFIARVGKGEGSLKSFLSDSLDKPQVARSFVKRATAANEQTQGLLKPQNETPFYISYPDDTPSFRPQDATVSAN